MVMLLSSNLASCRSKSCSCLDSNAYDSSILPLFSTKPPPSDLQTSDTSLYPIALQASAAAIDVNIVSSKAHAHRPETNGSMNPQFCNLDPEATPQEKEQETLKVVLGYETGVATLGDELVQMAELDGIPNAFRPVEDEPAKARICSFAAHSALGRQLLETLQAQLTLQRHGKAEHSMKSGILNSLRTIRAQYAETSRALRNETTTNASLTTQLQAERTARKLAEVSLADLLLQNFVLVEHNKLLVGRDTALQDDISSLVSQSTADNWMRLVLEDKLRSVSSACKFGNDEANPILRSSRSSISETPHRQEGMLACISESFSPTTEYRSTALRAQLVAVQDELHVTKRQLSVAEQRCDALSAKATSLQEHIFTCVDECGAALEVERELRYEVEARVHALLCETMALKSQAKLIGDGTDCQRMSMDVWKETSGHAHQMSGIAAAALERCDTLEKENLKQKDLIHELSERLATHEGLQTESKKLNSDIKRYHKKLIALQMKEKERAVDRQLQIKAVQRLVQRKTKRTDLNAQAFNQRAPSSRGLARFLKQVIRHRHASMPVIKALIEALPVMVVRHARRFSKALTEYSMAELNSLVNPSPSLPHDHHLRVPLFDADA